MAARARITRAERRGSWRLWAGVLTGPAAWSLQLLINYNLEELACSSASRQSGVLVGLGVETFILLVNVVAAAATVVAGLGALSCLRWKSDDESTGQRATWMAGAGVMTSILFLIAILTGFAPTFYLSVCL
jgi:hypothetical protein